jgi:vancomycin resistance protein YoaR
VRRDVVFASVLSIAAATVTGTGTWLYFDWLPAGRALPGMTVGGQLQPAHVGLGDWLEARRKALLSTETYLALPEGEGTVRTTLGDLGVELDVAGTMKAVRRDAEDGKLTARLYRAMKARRGETDVELRWAFDPERAKVTLNRLAPDVWRDPVDARLDLGAHRRIDEEPGRELDVAGTLTLIREGDRSDIPVIPIAVTPVPAQVTGKMLAQVDVTKVLASFETNFGGTGHGRAVNIGHAAEYLNGLVLAPGQSFSFNKVVGPRTAERGFVMAPVIKDDELEPGLGGGTCQVASTVHAAAVYSGLDIVQRRSHSRPSGYAPLGLDATVIYGEVDLKIRNPYDTPLLVHAFLPNPTHLRVEFLGRDLTAKVEHTYAVIRTHDFYRRVWTKPFLAPGKTLRRQKGKKGYDVVSVVKIRYPDGREEEKRYFSGYRPVPEVFWVAPGADMGELPELPEGAEHVEIDGVSSDPPLAETSAPLDAPRG